MNNYLLLRRNPSVTRKEKHIKNSRVDEKYELQIVQKFCLICGKYRNCKQGSCEHLENNYTPQKNVLTGLVLAENHN